MAQTQTASGLENLLANATERTRRFAASFAPVFKSQEDDVKYLEELLVKRDNRFRQYSGTSELRDYLKDIISYHKGILTTSKVAETLDRLGIFFVGEEIVEIPMKALLYVGQVAKLIGDKRLNVPLHRIAGMTAKYGLFELASVVPFVGELFDITNVYYKQYMKSIASGIRYDAFARANSRMVSP